LNAWQQLNVAFPDWNGAESLAVASIIPLLAEAEADGQVPSWFFIRKQPAWRIRYRLSGTGHPTETTIWRRLDDLAASGCISGWNHGVYEPEVHAFGGDEAMRAAHRFFHGDSNGCLAYLASERATRQPDRRRELSLLLCARMLRAAGLDWYEQGDVWARVAAHRDPPASATAAHADGLREAARRLIGADIEGQLRPGTSLAHVADWADVYLAAGRELARLNSDGCLHRGVRDVLAHHLIFAWNRLGLPHATQAVLASTAKAAVFGPDPTSARTL
jgi:thiopeptide-type bacteriocin biosynthesis protein